MQTGLSLRADDLVRLVEAGVLGPDDRVELLDGEVVWMSAIGARHVALVGRLNRILAADAALICSVQGPLRLGEDTELYPDLLLCREDYVRETRVPAPQDAVLVVEVSDTTLAYDLRKLARYAAAGIPEAWIVDVDARIVRTYRQPQGDAYLIVGGAVGVDRISPAGAPALAVGVAQLFADVALTG